MAEVEDVRSLCRGKEDLIARFIEDLAEKQASEAEIKSKIIEFLRRCVYGGSG